MKRLIYFTVVFLFWCINSNAQISAGGIPPSFMTGQQTTIPSFDYELNIAQILREDSLMNDSAFACGKPINVNIDLINEASSFLLPDSGKVMQLRISSKDAFAIGFEFSEFYLPDGVELYVYNENKSMIAGAFTSANNKPGKEFAIQAIAGDNVILEYYEPQNLTDSAIIIINRIGHFYKDIVEVVNRPTYKTNGCYEDVHCATNIGIDRAVVKWRYYDTNDEWYYTCSGALINQDVDSDDLKPYIFTANHCGKNAKLSTAIFYFNYQNPDCNLAGGTSVYSMAGAKKIAKRSVLDMYLMELDQFPLPDYNVHLAGWDRQTWAIIWGFVAGIHHPEGLKKSISEGTLLGNTNPNFWRVEWDGNDSPTETGSSGSPLFEDFSDRIIGQLAYGTSSCDNIDGKDRYGKLRKEWTGPSSNKRLKDWLDPADNDKDYLDGRDPCFDNLNIKNRFLNSAKQYYQPINSVTIQANNTITTSGNLVWVADNAEYTFRAGDRITLKSGFHAKKGSKFHAYNGPCTRIAEPTSRPGDKTNNSVSDSDDIDIIKYEYQDSISELNINTIHNYPNPFNQYTAIEYSLMNSEFIAISVYDVFGEEIEILVNNVFHKSGIYQINFDSKKLTPGIYFYSIRSKSFTKTGKMSIMK